VLLITSLLLFLGNLVGDLLVAVVDPRIRYH
jgi:ABC-type dipeptide/oligopeptide/nickel transport system permease component